MNKLTLAFAASASLAVSACSGNTEDNLGNADLTGENAAELDALADDAANDAEAEALGNQLDQLEQEGAANTAATDELNASTDTSADENVSGM